jgi:hypothetical protein
VVPNPIRTATIEQAGYIDWNDWTRGGSERVPNWRKKVTIEGRNRSGDVEDVVRETIEAETAEDNIVAKMMCGERHDYISKEDRGRHSSGLGSNGPARSRQQPLPFLIGQAIKSGQRLT